MAEIDYIKSKMTKPEILAALAEESAEMAQAALKLRRVLDGSNPTPVTEEEALENLLEEYGGVVNCIGAILTPAQNSFAMEMRQSKIARWVKRLRKAYTAGYKLGTKLCRGEKRYNADTSYFRAPGEKRADKVKNYTTELTK